MLHKKIIATDINYFPDTFRYEEAKLIATLKLKITNGLIFVRNDL